MLAKPHPGQTCGSTAVFASPSRGIVGSPAAVCRRNHRPGRCIHRSTPPAMPRARRPRRSEPAPPGSVDVEMTSESIVPSRWNVRVGGGVDHCELHHAIAATATATSSGCAELSLESTAADHPRRGLSPRLPLLFPYPAQSIGMYPMAAPSHENASDGHGPAWACSNTAAPPAAPVTLSPSTDRDTPIESCPSGDHSAAPELFLQRAPDNFLVSMGSWHKPLQVD